MGAMFWCHFSGPVETPEQALYEIQMEALRQYDLPCLIESNLQAMQEAVAATEVEDEYGLLDFYQSELARFEAIAEQGVPEEPAEQIALVRKIFASSGEGVGNILDVTGIATDDYFSAKPCTDDQLTELAAPQHPTRDEAEQIAHKLSMGLDRGQSFYFPFFSDDRRAAAGWCFVGNTVD